MIWKYCLECSFKFYFFGIFTKIWKCVKICHLTVNFVRLSCTSHYDPCGVISDYYVKDSYVNNSFIIRKFTNCFHQNTLNAAHITKVQFKLYISYIFLSKIASSLWYKFQINNTMNSLNVSLFTISIVQVLQFYEI